MHACRFFRSLTYSKSALSIARKCHNIPYGNPSFRPTIYHDGFIKIYEHKSTEKLPITLGPNKKLSFSKGELPFVLNSSDKLNMIQIELDGKQSHLFLVENLNILPHKTSIYGDYHWKYDKLIKLSTLKNNIKIKLVDSSNDPDPRILYEVTGQKVHYLMRPFIIYINSFKQDYKNIKDKKWTVVLKYSIYYLAKYSALFLFKSKIKYLVVMGVGFSICYFFV